ncbi:glycosyltransferase family 4 protein [Sunxiuqinia elliptica]|uniref:(1->4)-alpha-D-glucan synthase (ADP-glucose) n=1 Tax=Sunxiuqinia elliptica TaxID=655355 RepID=A0A1I2KIZ6_9BACT|nr:glycosyltransferase family 4 protein [Sunxiuqinia elliptica]TDO03375.1 (1->4)-alpha-D-glucan synthase (ADP-glucose) [Sunxiuqinia elliptica]TDO59572.1 (1->4)-alpha-D-glucan synthase (ADP-glucose) [Sunxiuqinia elliptica]SFF66269.1 Glycosyltransferase involved in cell wall bisynthesis [Sunxiuqinia elliptica]
MKVLMFGWEFPPHISGGLGTACYGLTRGLAAYKDVDVTFVVPKAHGDEDQSSMKLIGANDIPITRKQVHFRDLQKKIDYYEVESGMVPYMDPEEFWKLSSKKYSNSTRFIETNEEGKLHFTGKYGNDLLYEIYKYSLVAEVIARDQEFDLIHAHDWLAYPAGIAAKEISGKPLVIHVHATDFDRSGGSVNPQVFEIEQRGMHAADKIITVSNLTRRIVIEKYGIDPAKVTTVYNAVEPVSKEEKARLKKGVNDKIVTFLGRITMQKGPEYFVEAASLVLKKMSNVRFVMAGSGDMMNNMVKRAAELKIADSFHFTGFLKGDDVFDMFRMSDVFVMPSVSEPFGIVPLEAMQTNVPVIISNQSGVSEILKYAVKTDYWDTHAMADAIYGLLNYPGMWNMFMKYGKKEVDSLQWKNSARNVRDVYYDALKID